MLEALLQETFAKHANDNERIADLMGKLEPANLALEQRDSSLNRGRRRTISFAIAATIFLAVSASLFFASLDNTAFAAVMRSLTAVPATREYRIKMLHQFPVLGQKEFDAELFLDNSNRFVVHHPGWNGLGDFWVGGSPDARWIVPKIGPSLTGENQMIAGWLSKRGIPSPYLHVTTILERLSQSYTLELLANEPIANANDPSEIFQCQHIVGVASGRDADRDTGNRPARIELWADSQTGVARKVILNWQRNRLERGPIQWKIELVGSPELAGGWFQLDGHVEQGRPSIRIRSAADLDAIEIQRESRQ